MNGWMVLTGSHTNRPGATTSESLAAKSVGWDTLQFLNSSWTDKPNNCFIVINSPMGAPLTQTPHHARHGEGPLQVHHMESGFCECWIDPGQATLAISINKMHNSSTKGMYFKLFYHVFSNHDDFQTSPKVRPPPAVANGFPMNSCAISTVGISTMLQQLLDELHIAPMDIDCLRNNTPHTTLYLRWPGV